MNIPGTPAAMMTAINGHATAKAGNAGPAYGLALAASSLGGLISRVALATMSPLLSRVAFHFGPAEYAVIALASLLIVAQFAGKNLTKGLFSLALGCALSIVGIDPFSGLPRWTFGATDLLKGIEVLPALIGLLIPPELVFSSFERRGVRLGYSPRFCPG